MKQNGKYTAVTIQVHQLEKSYLGVKGVDDVSYCAARRDFKDQA